MNLRHKEVLTGYHETNSSLAQYSYYDNIVTGKVKRNSAFYQGMVFEAWNGNYNSFKGIINSPVGIKIQK